MITYPNYLDVSVKDTIAFTPLKKTPFLDPKDLTFAMNRALEGPLLEKCKILLSGDEIEKIRKRYQDDLRQKKNLHFYALLGKIIYWIQMARSTAESEELLWFITDCFHRFDLKGELPYKALFSYLITSQFDFNHTKNPWEQRKNSLWHNLLAFEDQRLLDLLELLDAHPSQHAKTLKIKINTLRDWMDQTPLILLAKIPNPQQEAIAKLLISLGGIRITDQDDEGNTAIHWALLTGSYGLLKLLKEKFPKDFAKAIQLKNKEGLSAYMMAEALSSENDTKIKDAITLALHAIQVEPKRSYDAPKSFFSIALPNEKQVTVFAAKAHSKTNYSYEIIMGCPCCQGGAKDDYAVLMHPTAGFQNNLQQMIRKGTFFIVQAGDKGETYRSLLTPKHIDILQTTLRKLSPKTLLDHCLNQFRAGCQLILDRVGLVESKPPSGLGSAAALYQTASLPTASHHPDIRTLGPGWRQEP